MQGKITLISQLAPSVSVSFIKWIAWWPTFVASLFLSSRLSAQENCTEKIELWMFYVHNGRNVSVSVTWNNDNKDIETFCEILTKLKVVAFLLPPNIQHWIEILAAKHLAIPVRTDLPKSSKDTQVILIILH
jgi:hypothetical protein